MKFLSTHSLPLILIDSFLHRRAAATTTMIETMSTIKFPSWSIKPRPNDRNSSTQPIATLLDQYLLALANFLRNISQHYWAQHVARVWPPCCDVLQHVAS